MPALLTEGRLRNHPFLHDSSREFLNRLEEFSTDVTFRSGEVILREGHYADRGFLIWEGKVRLESRVNGSAGALIQELGPGDVLGWSWIFPPFRWHFTARAVEPCKMVALNAPSLLIRAEEDPVFGYELMKRIGLQLVQRLEATRSRLAEELRRTGGNPML